MAVKSVRVYIFLIFSTVLLQALSQTSDCPCGYGGLCLPGDSGPIDVDCKLCDQISGGWYKDCSTIINHCESNPCERGQCRPTFGGYHCICPGHYSGMNCEINLTSEMSVNPLLTGISVYYQIQPTLIGHQRFMIIFPDELVMEFDNLLIEVIVSDGREFFPLLENMDFTDVHALCTSDSEAYPDLLDIRVCDLLPKGNVVTFLIDPYLLTPLSQDQDDIMFIPEINEAIGRVGSIWLSITWAKREETAVIIFSRRYKIFSYYYLPRAPNKCLLEFSFDECSTNKNDPVRHARGSMITIRSRKKIIRCKGFLYRSTSWFLQPLSETSPEPMPYWLSDFDGHESVYFEKRYFEKGLQMLMFTYTLQGNPPHYGGTTIFRKSAICWMFIELGDISVQMEGGDVFSVSCLNPMEIPIVNLNSNMDLDDIMFTTSCNHRDDPECAQTALYAPILWKKYPRCNTSYVYLIEASTADYALTALLYVDISFVESDVRLQIKCHFNCHPIDPHYKSIWVVDTLPYTPNPVEWSVFKNDEKINKSSGGVSTFLPWTASRILILEPNETTIKDVNSIDMRLRASHSAYGNQYAESISITDDLRYSRKLEVETVHFDSSLKRYKFTVTSSEPLVFAPLLFIILQVHEPTRGLIVVTNSYHEDLLLFEPTWDAVTLCYLDAKLAFSCAKHPIKFDHKFGQVNVKTFLTFHDLEGLFHSGDFTKLLREIDELFVNDITSEEGKPLQWKMEAEKRIDIIELINEVVSSDLYQSNVLVVLHILSLIFYSAEGNAIEGLPEFINDLKADSDFKTINQWLYLRHLSLECLLKVSNAVEHISIDSDARIRSLLNFPFGNLLSRYIDTFSLAHAQAISFYPMIRVTDNDFIDGEITFNVWKNEKTLKRSILGYAKAVSNYMVLYYGVAHFGSNHALVWTVNDSYAGIMYALNRSRGTELKFFSHPPREPDDKRNASESEWFHDVEVGLPPPEGELLYRELTFTAILLKNQPYDSYISPLLFIIIKMRNQKYLNELPYGLGYRVKLPISRNRHDGLEYRFNDTIEQPNEGGHREYQEPSYLALHYFNVYKVTLPAKSLNFFMEILLSDPVSIKGKVTLDHVPNYYEVWNSSVLPLEHNHEGFYSSNITISAEDTRVFYIGFLPSDELPVGKKLTLFLTTSFDVCQVQHPEVDEYIEPCIKERKNIGFVRCVCHKLGIVTAHRQEVRYSKIWMDPIFYVHKRPLYFGHMLITFVLAIFFIVALIVAYLADRRRRRQEILMHFDDNYRYDEYVLILGVYTGITIGAGTRSTVAIKVFGEKGQSKVHLLKCKGRKTLRRGSDDWFILTMSEHPGRLREICIWHNFHNASNWYCSRIVIYDSFTYRWYKIEVERWFKLYDSNDESRLATFEVHHIFFASPDLPHSFVQHFVEELRNVHHTVSIFVMHPRVLYTYEQRTMIMLLKILCIFWWVCFAQEFILEDINVDGQESQGAKWIVALREDILLIAFAVSVLATLSVIPLEAVYRMSYMSSIIQRKTTNPIQSLSVTSDDSRRSRTLSRYRATENRSLNSQEMMVDMIRKPLRGKRSFWWTIRAVLFTPCQFYWVNANRGLYDRQIRYTTAVARSLAAIALLGLYAPTVYILWGTPFKSKSLATAYLVIVAVVADVFIVNPIFILIQSFITFYLFKVSNQEEYLFGDDLKISPPQLIPCELYLSKATSKDYKPLLSAQIEKSRAMELTLKMVIESLFYFLGVIVIIINCFVILERHDESQFYNFNVVKYHLVKPQVIQLTDTSGIAIENVLDHQTVTKYIVHSYIPLFSKWYSGKFISKNKMYWFRDFTSLPLDTTVLLFLFASPNSTLRRPDMFSRYYTTAYGYLSESSPYEQPLLILDSFLYYSRMSRDSVYGKSGEEYPMAGHNITVGNSDWAEYYGKMRTLLNDLRSKASAIPLRFLCMSNNMINAYAKNLLTTDLIVEYHPSGVCTATVKISVMKMDEGILWTAFFAMIAVGFSILIVILASMYLSNYEGILFKVIFLSLLILATVGTYYDIRGRTKAIEDLQLAPKDVHIDVHNIHARGFRVSCYLYSPVLMFLLYNCWIIRSSVIMACIRVLPSFRRCLLMFLSGVIICQTVSMCFADDRIFKLIVIFYTKTFQMYFHSQRYDLLFVMFIIAFLHKTCTGLLLYEYYSRGTDEKLRRDNLLMRLVDACRAKTVDDTEDLQSFRKKNVKVLSFQEPLVTTMTPPPLSASIDEETDRRVRPSTLLLKKFKIFRDT